MESLIDEIDSLVAPDLSTTAADWCENCQSLKQDVKKLQDEQEQRFVKLKQKIISTNLLIKKYKSKCEDYDVQFKKNEEATKRADKFHRQSEILETQLKAALMETEPLRASKVVLESDVKKKNAEIEELSHKLVIAEGAQKQYEHLNKSTYAETERLEAEKKDLNAKIKILESAKVTKEAAKELKHEVSTLKKENTILRKKEKQLEKKLQAAVLKIEHLNERLKESKMAPADRRRRTTSGSLLSPVRSPIRSPRMRKLSQSSPNRGTPKSSPRQQNKVETMDTREDSSYDSSDEEDDDDDTQSIMSYKWTFSPMMPCLSPLPPSPAFCQEMKSDYGSRLSDEDDNLSDMADDLEQQILGDYVADDKQDESHEEAKTHIKHQRDDEKEVGNVNGKQTDCKSSDNTSVDTAAAAAEAINSKIKTGPSGDNSTEKTLSSSLSGIPAGIPEMDQQVIELTASISENSIRKSELSEDRKSVKERIAASMDIVSPRANRKPIVQSANRKISSDITNSSLSVSPRVSTGIPSTTTTSNRTDEVPNGNAISQSIKDNISHVTNYNSCRSNSQEATVEGSNELIQGISCDTYLNSSKSLIGDKTGTGNIIEDKSEETKSFPRADTLEFDPLITEDAEKENDIGWEDSVQTVYVDKGWESCAESNLKNKDSEHSADKTISVTGGKSDSANDTVTEIGKKHIEKVKTENEVGVNVRKYEKCNVNVQYNNIEIPKTIAKEIETNDGEQELIKEIQQVVVNITEETDPVKSLRKTPPPLHGHLKRQFPVDKQTESPEESVSPEEKSQKMLKTKFTFTKFQKASYGTLEDEISYLQDTNNYNVLARGSPLRVKESVHTKKFKNMKKKLKSNFKFKDLDSTGSSGHKQEQQDIALAFMRHGPRGDTIEKDNTGHMLENKKGMQAQKDHHTSKDHSDSTLEMNIETDGHTNDQTLDGFENDNIKDMLTNDTTVELSIAKTPSIVEISTEQQEEKQNNAETKIKEKLKNEESLPREIEIHEEKCTGNLCNDLVTEKNVITGIGIDEAVKPDDLLLTHNSERTDASENDLEQTNKKTFTSPSRQISTGFIVNQSSVEISPTSVESPVGYEPVINDNDRNKLGTDQNSVIPHTGQTKISSCETITEESEYDLDFNEEKIPNRDDKCTVNRDDGEGKTLDSVNDSDILGGDDLSSEETTHDDDNSRDIPFISKEVINESSEEMQHKQTGEISDFVPPVSLLPEPTVSNDDLEEMRYILEPHTNICSKPDDEYSAKSSFYRTEEPGCSFHYKDNDSALLLRQDFECVTVTSTSSLTTSSRSLVCTPDNTDNDSLILCQSHSRSTTPSICSIDMSTPPLSPLSISPFDFIIPVSPLPLSPVRQVDRVSPLSPDITETLDNELEENASNELEENPSNESEENASNENEKNICNIPSVMTPEKPILNKLIEYSPLPDLISPIKTPKQLSAKQKERRRVKKDLSSKGQGNTPVKFVSSAPIGILAVKPKTEVDSLNHDMDTDQFCNVNQISMKSLDLRKHVTLKKSLNIWSNKDSLFKRQDRSVCESTKSVNERTSSDSAIKSESEIQLKQRLTGDLSGNGKTERNLNLPKPKSEDSAGSTKVITDLNNAVNSSSLNTQSTINLNVNSATCDSNSSDSRKTASDSSTIQNGKNKITSETLKTTENVKKEDLKYKMNASNLGNRQEGGTSLKTVQMASNKVVRNIKKAIERGNSKGVISSTRPNEKGEGVIVKHEMRVNVAETQVDQKGDSTEQQTDIVKPAKPEADVLPAGYDPLMASKRKTRMAHQPKSSQAVMRKPPIVIEPAVFIQPTRRKRKSLDSADKNVPKKQAKGNIFHKRKDDSSTDSTYLENCKKMEAFLKSTTTSHNFINEIKDYPPENSHGVYLVELCLECIGRVKTDMLDYIYHSCESGSYLTVRDEWPFLSDVEKKTIELLVYINQSTHLKMSRDTILKMVWEKIFTKELTVTMTGKMALSRIFTAICQREGDVEQVRVLFHHIATCGYLNHWLFVVPVVSVWPSVLKKCPDASNRDDSGMVMVFEFVITKSLVEQGTESSKKVLAIMRKLCNWSESTDGPEILLKVLTTQLFDINSSLNTENKDLTFELVKACNLLLMNKSWPWIKDHFISRQGLQPAVNRYLCKNGTVTSNYVCAILDITGSLISSMSEYIKQRDLQQICKTWLMSILSKQEGDPVVQMNCLKILLEISVFIPSVIIDLHSWFRKNPDNSVQGYANQLESLRQAYTEKFGLVCEPLMIR